jgi:integrase
MSDLVADFLASKRNVAPETIRNLRQQTERLAVRFPLGLEAVESAEVEAFLDSLPSARTRLNNLNTLRALVTYAKRHRFLAASFELDPIVVANVRPPAPQIYGPEEGRRLLETAQARRPYRKLVPFLAIGAFAGVRHAEIKRLDWADVNLDEGLLFVSRRKAKTGLDRAVELPANCVAWLRLHQSTGPIVRNKNTTSALRRLQAHAGVPKRRNGLRKSCLTYRTALARNLEAVALDSGNSAAMLKRNYLAIGRMSRRSAEQWFAIRPPGGDGKQLLLDFTIQGSGTRKLSPGAGL